MGIANPPPSDRRISSSTESAEIDSMRWRCETLARRAVRSAAELEEGDESLDDMGCELDAPPSSRRG